MSRSDYVDDYEYAACWMGAVNRALSGKRGQTFLREMLAALDAMPVKALAPNVLVQDGEACAMGAVALARGLDVSEIDETDRNEVAAAFNIAPAMAAEIAYENDEGAPHDETAEQRWTRMRAWVVSQINVRPDELLNAEDVEDPTP